MGKRRKFKPGEFITENRSLLRIGGSWYIGVAPEWVKAHGLKHKDKVPTTANHLFKAIPHSER